MDLHRHRRRRKATRKGVLGDPDLELAARAATVGLDQLAYKVLHPDSPDGRLVYEALVTQVEQQDLQRLRVLAELTGKATIEQWVALQVELGVLKRKTNLDDRPS